MKLPRPRFHRKSRPKPPKGYDSFFEHDLHSGPLRGCKHHSEKIRYTVEREYEPDFIYHADKCTVLIESKGRMRDAGEAAKYIWINKALPKRYKLVFVFQNPNLPMPNAKRRKDGTKRTHGEWATDHGFEYYTPDNVPKDWSVKK